jgi:hypothetical protein
VEVAVAHILQEMLALAALEAVVRVLAQEETAAQI